MRDELGRALSFILIAGLVASVCCGFTIDFLRSKIRPRVVALVAANHYKHSSSIVWLLLSPQAVTMLLVSCVALCLSCLVFLPEVWAHYTNCCLLVLFRGFLFSTISSSILNGFPLEQFGTLYGVSAGIAGLFSCLQYAIILPAPNIGNWINFPLAVFMFGTPTFILYRSFKQWKLSSIAK